MPHETGLIATVAAGFALAFVLGLVAQRLRLPPIVGYLLAGVAVGPFTPGFVADGEVAAQLAEIGVILLMFGVGLHFSLRDLLAVRKISLPGAIVQISVATAMGAGLARLWGWSWGQGLVLGLSLSVASTVVLLRALENRGLVGSVDGRIAVGWLIVEDLVTVLALVLLPAVAVTMGGAGLEGADAPLGATLALTLGKIVAFIGTILVVGRRVVPWLLDHVARTGSRELFTLAVLAVALGIAVGSATLFDVSFALGAFFAGMVIAESDLSHRAAADALPFQDAFAVLFFVSVGMLFDPSVLVDAPWQVVGVLAIILVGKSLAAFAIVLLFRYPVRSALVVAASLAQIGEFSFILASLGRSLELLPPDGESLIVAGALLSITVNPIIFSTIDPWERYLRNHPRVARLLERPGGALSLLPPVQEHTLSDHVVLVGHGRVGAPVAEALEEQGIPYVVVEQNREVTEVLRERGLPVIYGDASRPGILDHAHLERARLLIVSAEDTFEARRIVEHARAVNPAIDMVVRTHSDEERARLERMGVGRAVVAERELALAIVRYAFGTFGIEQDMLEVAARTLQLDDPHTGRRVGQRPTR
ncbi:MAG TPA: YbaL family putative K(+) efflux transporter [Egibacteraceae bacterium]